MTPADVPALFVQAWNARDADALASLFDGDAEFVNGTGLCWHGREAIRKGHATRLQSVAHASMLAADDTNVKFLLPEVAIVHARMTLAARQRQILSPHPRHARRSSRSSCIASANDGCAHRPTALT